MNEAKEKGIFLKKRASSSFWNQTSIACKAFFFLFFIFFWKVWWLNWINRIPFVFHNPFGCLICIKYIEQRNGEKNKVFQVANDQF